MGLGVFVGIFWTLFCLADGQNVSFQSDTPYLLPIYNEETQFSRCQPTNQTIYDFQVPTLDGTYMDLTPFKGRVLMVTNTATYCALTEQYVHFNRVLDEVSPRGFSIFAFPCNQFLYLEPGMNHEILNGLKSVRPGHGYTPHQDLHIFGKVDVNGEAEHPLFTFLKETCPSTGVRIGLRKELFWDPIKTSDIAWNFEKFLIDRNGIPRYRFYPTAWASGEFIMPYIQELLNETSPNLNGSSQNPMRIHLRQVVQNSNQGYGQRQNFGQGQNQPLMGYNQEFGSQASDYGQPPMTYSNDTRPIIQILNYYGSARPNQPSFGPQTQVGPYQQDQRQQPCCQLDPMTMQALLGGLANQPQNNQQPFYSPNQDQNFQPSQNYQTTPSTPNQFTRITPAQQLSYSDVQQVQYQPQNQLNPNFGLYGQNQSPNNRPYNNQQQFGGQQNYGQTYGQYDQRLNFGPSNQQSEVGQTQGQGQVWPQNSIQRIISGYGNSSSVKITSRTIYEVEAEIRNP